MNWDEHFVSKYAKEIGCTALYLDPLEDVPICENQVEMRQWHDFLPNLKNKKDNFPCQEMPSIDYDISYSLEEFNLSDTFSIGMTYPKQAKIVAQTRAVDYHSLIGNIGGYIGLFLGTIEQ